MEDLPLLNQLVHYCYKNMAPLQSAIPQSVLLINCRFYQVYHVIFVLSITFTLRALSGFESHKKEKNRYITASVYSGAPQGTRTPDLLVRSQTLYPAELAAHSCHRQLIYNITFILVCQYLFYKKMKLFNSFT